MGFYLVNRRKNEGPPPPDVPVRVEVLNGCGAPGIARKAQAWLRDQGYDVVSIGDAYGHFPTTIIIERRDRDKQNAYALARTLRLGRRSVTLSLDTLSPVWVTLILGEDYKKYVPDSAGAIQ